MKALILLYIFNSFMSIVASYMFIFQLPSDDSLATKLKDFGLSIVASILWPVVLTYMVIEEIRWRLTGPKH